MREASQNSKQTKQQKLTQQSYCSAFDHVASSLQGFAATRMAGGATQGMASFTPEPSAHRISDCFVLKLEQGRVFRRDGRRRGKPSPLSRSPFGRGSRLYAARFSTLAA